MTGQIEHQTTNAANGYANRRQPVRAPRLIVDDATEIEEGWQHFAACAGTDAEIYFPISDAENGPVAQLQIEEAKAVCADCPVIGSCLRWALTVGEDFGVWGGMSAKERKAMKRQAYRAEVRQAKQAAA